MVTRQIEEIANEVVNSGEIELREIEVSKEEAKLLEENWKEFVALLPQFFHSRIVLVKGDSFDEFRHYLLVSAIKTCDH